jgi:peroxisomal enoyl-CoA hydratase 2
LFPPQELHPSFAAFPTYPIILPFKKTTQEVIDFYAAQASRDSGIPGVPKLDSKRVVDGERSMTFLKPIPTTSEGRSFELRQRVLGVYDKGKPGTVMETQMDLVDKASGEVYANITGSAFFVGQGNWNGPKGPKSQNFPPPEGKAPDAVYEHQTTAETPHLYRLNGHGLWRRDHARLVLVELDGAWLAEVAGRQRSGEPEGVCGEVRVAG